MLSRRRGLALAICGMSFAMSLSGPVAAQEVLPSTPPELEDFRLDTPPPRDKAPEAQPQPQPQPKAETPAPKQSANPARSAPAAPRNAAAEEADPAREVGPPPASSDPAPSAPDDAAVENALPLPAQPGAAAAAEIATEGTPSQPWLAYWPYLAALLAALTAFGLFRAFHKRSVEQNAVRALSATDPVPVPVRTPQPRAAKAKSPPVRQPATVLNARFENGNARLSLANLTITGQLHLNYSGTEPLDNIMMRTLVMSASDGQATSIAAFHNDDAQGDRETLGDMTPGESMTVKLELRVPRGALQAFDWRDRRFVAPIILVNIVSSNTAIAPCRLACVVGQAGNADSPRLLPIPIDRGPKRFEGVQFQPIAA